MKYRYESEKLDDVELILRGIVIEDIAADFEDIFRDLGFDDIKVTELKQLPDHVWEWVGGGFDEDLFEELVESDGVPRYWSVSTRQGSFGVLYAGPPVIDLAGSGVRLQDLLGEEVGCDPDFQFIPMGSDDLMTMFVVQMHMNFDFAQEVERWSTSGG